jgi:hypothetical protein
LSAWRKSESRVRISRLLCCGRLRLVAHGAHLVSHPAMSHVGHREHRSRIELGYGGAQTVAHGDRARGEACPVH